MTGEDIDAGVGGVDEAERLARVRLSVHVEPGLPSVLDVVATHGAVEAVRRLSDPRSADRLGE